MHIILNVKAMHDHVKEMIKSLETMCDVIYTVIHTHLKWKGGCFEKNWLKSVA